MNNHLLKIGEEAQTFMLLVSDLMWTRQVCSDQKGASQPAKGNHIKGELQEVAKKTTITTGRFPTQITVHWLASSAGIFLPLYLTFVNTQACLTDS